MTLRASSEREVSERFFGLPAPTLVSTVGSSPPLSFSRLTCENPCIGQTKAARVEDAYAVHIMLRPNTGMKLWLCNREIALPPIPEGGVIIGHLETEPVASYQSAFDFLRLYIARTTIEELSSDTYGKLPEGLRRPDYGASDPVLLSLASAVAQLLGRQLPDDQLLMDQLALAFHAHLTEAYAGRPRDQRSTSARGLAPWQEKRAKDYFLANLGRTVSLVEVAGICGLSPGHFARAFRATTGRPPHRWLLERRVEAAKRVLETSDRPLSEISKTCGFSDASHFSRVFSKATREAPAAWRRARGRAHYAVSVWEAP